MVLRLAQRAGVFRHLQLSRVISRPTRVAFVHSYIKRVSPPTNGLVLNSIVNGAPLGARVGMATAARPRAGAKKATKSTRGSKPTRSTKSAGSSRSTKSAKSKKTGTKGKKKTTKKAKPAAKPKKKQLTPRQKELKEAKEQREKLKQLKEASLEPPKKLIENAWNLALRSKLPETVKKHEKVSDAFKAAAELARTISQEEKQRYASEAESNKAKNKAVYGDWVKSHTPLQIKDANQARRRLAKIRSTKLRLIDDDRLVKRPMTAYMQFLQERNRQGDFKHMNVMDISAKVAQEWKGLTNAEKEKYHKMQANDRERYLRQYKQTYGEDAAMASA